MEETGFKCYYGECVCVCVFIVPLCTHSCKTDFCPFLFYFWWAFQAQQDGRRAKGNIYGVDS